MRYISSILVMCLYSCRAMQLYSSIVIQRNSHAVIEIYCYIVQSVEHHLIRAKRKTVLAHISLECIYFSKGRLSRVVVGQVG